MKKIDDIIILRYLQGECTEQELMELNEWIKESEDNRNHLFMLQESFDARNLERYSDSRFIAKAEKQLLNQMEAMKNERSYHLPIRKVMQYAAIFLFIIASSFAIIHFVGTWNTEAMTTITANESVKECTLPDGTKVWLNRHSTIKYPQTFADDHRNVELVGEGYFEVTKDKKRPFTVATQAMQIRVLGTKFNVRNIETDAIAEASLLEGEVQVTGNKQEGQVILAPGQKAELDTRTGKLCVKQVNAQLDAVWRDDLIPFDKATVSEIASTLERFYHVKITLSPDVDNNTYSGVLKRKESIDSVLNSLKNSIPIKYKMNGNQIQISQLHYYK